MVCSEGLWCLVGLGLLLLCLYLSDLLILDAWL